MDLYHSILNYGVQAIIIVLGVVVSYEAKKLAPKAHAFINAYASKYHLESLGMIANMVVNEVENVSTSATGAEKRKQAIDKVSQYLSGLGIHFSESEVISAIEKEVANLDKGIIKATTFLSKSAPISIGSGVGSTLTVSPNASSTPVAPADNTKSTKS